MTSGKDKSRARERPRAGAFLRTDLGAGRGHGINKSPRGLPGSEAWSRGARRCRVSPASRSAGQTLPLHLLWPWAAGGASRAGLCVEWGPRSTAGGRPCILTPVVTTWEAGPRLSPQMGCRALSKAGEPLHVWH